VAANQVSYYIYGFHSDLPSCIRENERPSLELLLLSNHVSIRNEQKNGVIITDEMVGNIYHIILIM